MKIKKRTKKEKTPLFAMLLSVLSGLWMCAAFNFEKIDLTAFVALVPMLSAMFFYRERECGLIKCVFFYIIAYYGPNLLWLYRMCPMTNYGISAPLSYILITLSILTISAVEGFLFVLAFLPFNRLRRTKIPMFIIFPVLYTLAEFIQAHAGELSFPWGRLGVVIAGRTNLIQTASLFGSLCVSFIVVLFNSLAAEAAVAVIKNRSYKKAAIILLCAVCLFSLNAGFGAARVSGIEKSRDNSEGVTVAVVQANLGSMDKWDTKLSDALEKYISLSESVRDKSPDIYVWSETAVTANMSNTSVMGILESFAKNNNATLVTGIFDGENNEYNAMTAIHSDGTITAPYYKRELVPMGEKIPFSEIFEFIKPESFGDIVPGTEAVTLDTSYGIAGGLICYESIYPYVARENVDNGAEYFLMISNDSWFDGSAALRQHFNHAVLRCVENGRDMARSGNTGITAVISASGTVEKEVEPNAESVVVDKIVPRSSKTLYSRFGDIIAVPLALFYLFGMILLVQSRLKNRKERKTDAVSHNF